MWNYMPPYVALNWQKVLEMGPRMITTATTIASPYGVYVRIYSSVHGYFCESIDWEGTERTFQGAGNTLSLDLKGRYPNAHRYNHFLSCTLKSRKTLLRVCHIYIYLTKHLDQRKDSASIGIWVLIWKLQSAL